MEHRDEGVDTPAWAQPVQRPGLVLVIFHIVFINVVDGGGGGPASVPSMQFIHRR